MEAIERHLKSRGTGSSDRRNRWFAIKSFHEYHRLSLPRLQRIEASKAFEPYEMDKSRAVALKPLKVGR